MYLYICTRDHLRCINYIGIVNFYRLVAFYFYYTCINWEICDDFEKFAIEDKQKTMSLFIFIYGKEKQTNKQEKWTQFLNSKQEKSKLQMRLQYDIFYRALVRCTLCVMSYIFLNDVICLCDKWKKKNCNFGATYNRTYSIWLFHDLLIKFPMNNFLVTIDVCGFYTKHNTHLHIDI